MTSARVMWAADLREFLSCPIFVHTSCIRTSTFASRFALLICPHPMPTFEALGGSLLAGRLLNIVSHGRAVALHANPLAPRRPAQACRGGFTGW